MATTIDSLEIQIATSAGNSAQKIDELAAALGRLKANSGLTKVTNNLTKLSVSLNQLNTSLGSVTRLKELANTMQSLSGMSKLGNLNSAINALKKLPGVVEELNPVLLAKFTKQMEKLAKALEPVATRIDKVGKAFSQLPSKMNKMVSATNKMNSATKSMSNGIDIANVNLFTMGGNIEMVIQVVNTLVTKMTEFLSQAIEWDGIQFRFGQSFGDDAQGVYNWILKINEAMGINVQEFMQYSGLYASLLNGFGLAQDKVTAIATGLTELSYDIWAFSNDRFKSLEDASEAIRSAITGEIEPIRNAGIALTEASLQEYIDQTHLAGLSIEKLTEAQKAEIRYAAMVKSAMDQGIVGTYAREMDTAEGAVRSLSQSLKTLAQAFGSLFIPLLQIAVPYVTAFVRVLTDAVHALAAMLGIDIAKIDWSSTTRGVNGITEGAEEAKTGLDNATKAAKELRDYTMGFDELNVISPDKGSSNSGNKNDSGATDWGTGLDLDSIWDNALLAQADKQVDALKQKISDYFEEWKTELTIIGGALATLSVAKLLSGLGDALHWGETFQTVMGTIQKMASTAIVITVQFMLQTQLFSDFMGENGSIWDYIGALLIGAGASWIMYSMWGPTGLVIGLGVTALASLKAVIDAGGITDAESAVVAITGIATAVGAFALAWSKVGPAIANSQFGAFIAMLKEGYGFIPTLSVAFPGLSNAITGAATAVSGFLGGITAPVWATIVGVIAAVASAAYFLYENWESVKKVVKEFFDQNIAPKLEDIKGHFDSIKDALSTVKDAFSTAYEKFMDWLGIDMSFLESLGAVFEFIGGVVFTVVGTVIAGAFNTLVGIIENFIQIISGVISIVSGVVSGIVSLFSGDLQGAKDAVDLIGKGISDVFSGLWGLITKPLKDFVDGVIDFFVGLWDELVGHSIVPDTIDAIVDWFASLPGKILKKLGDFIGDVIEKFGEIVTSLKKKFETAWGYVKDFFNGDKWKSRANSAVGNAKKKLTELKDDIKAKLNTAWDYVKNFFKLENWKDKATTAIGNVKSKFTELRDNLKTKLDTAWGYVTSFFKIKNWTDKAESAISKLKTKFGEIQSSLKTKLEDAWDEVKDFFSVSNWKKKVESAIQTIKDNFKMPSFPKIKLEVTWSTNVGALKTAVYKALGLDGWPSLKWSTYAQGGFPSMGEMFVAREAGPELVGRIGNKTTVANNDQIVAAVSQGVYSAVRSAMGDNGGANTAQNVNVYLDGKQIYSSVKKTEAKRGASLMGNQIGYVY